MTREERLYNIAQNVVQRLLESNTSPKVLIERDDEDDPYGSIGAEFGKYSAGGGKPKRGKKIDRSVKDQAAQRFGQESPATYEAPLPVLKVAFTKFFEFDDEGKIVLNVNDPNLDAQLQRIREYLDTELKLKSKSQMEKFLKTDPRFELERFTGGKQMIKDIINMPVTIHPITVTPQTDLRKVFDFLDSSGNVDLSSDRDERADQLRQIRRYVDALNLSTSEIRAILAKKPFELGELTVRDILNLPKEVESKEEYEIEKLRRTRQAVTAQTAADAAREIKKQNLNISAATDYLKNQLQFNQYQVDSVLFKVFGRTLSGAVEKTGNISLASQPGGSRYEFKDLQRVFVDKGIFKAEKRGRRPKTSLELKPVKSVKDTITIPVTDKLLTQHLQRLKSGDMEEEELLALLDSSKDFRQLLAKYAPVVVYYFMQGTITSTQFYRDLREELPAIIERESEQDRSSKWKWVIGKNLLDMIFQILEQETSTIERVKLAEDLSKTYTNVPVKDFYKILGISDPSSIYSVNAGYEKPDLEYGPILSNSMIEWKDPRYRPYYSILQYFISPSYNGLLSTVAITLTKDYSEHSIEVKELKKVLDKSKFAPYVDLSEPDESLVVKTPGKPGRKKLSTTQKKQAVKYKGQFNIDDDFDLDF